MNSELYRTTIESFGVEKPSKLLISQARKAAMGKEVDIKLVKKEIQLCKQKEKVIREQAKADKLTAEIEKLSGKVRL